MNPVLKIAIGFMSLPIQAREAFGQAITWVKRTKLRIQHVDTLKRFHDKEYGNKDDTIDVAAAFNEGLLDPQALLSPLLATQISRLTDKKVLESWNQVTLDAMQTRPDGSRPPGAIPLNEILRNAAYNGDCETLEWLVKLENPTEKLHWDSRLLLMHDFVTARWALLWHTDLMNVPDPAYFVRTSLEPNGSFLPRNWLNHVDAPQTGYDQARAQLRDLRDHLHNLMYVYFKDMPWQARWSQFANPLTAISPVEPTSKKDGLQGLTQGHSIIEGLLYNAPLDVQKCLAAFKNSRHSKEDEHCFRDVEPKAIRHAFFDGLAPRASTPPELAAWLSLMQGTPPDAAADAWVQWQKNAPSMSADMDVPLPSDAFENPVAAS